MPSDPVQIALHTVQISTVDVAVAVVVDVVAAAATFLRDVLARGG